MNCKECNDKSVGMCSACKVMREKTAWIYEIDIGNRMCKCPKCKGRMTLGAYAYSNPYKYCPYCGEYLAERKGEQNDRRTT